jgi:hypothetical protein
MLHPGAFSFSAFANQAVAASVEIDPYPEHPYANASARRDFHHEARKRCAWMLGTGGGSEARCIRRSGMTMKSFEESNT